jgi:sensor histidine kinase YesM
MQSLIRVLLVNTAIAFIPPLLNVVGGEPPPFSKLVTTFLYSLVYSHCIGSLAFAAMPRLWIGTGKSPAWVKWPARATAAFGASVAGSLIAGLVFVALGWCPLSLYWQQFNASLKIAIFLTVVAGSLVSMYGSFRERLERTTLQLRTKELERERALKLATEAQLASLESRIHPHFLFNTLNSISSLIPEDPKRAEKLVEQMAALLRFSLDSNQSGLVPLGREMKIVSDYLEIERVRFGDRLRFRIEVAPELQDASVPPLAVQTLVENSVKHAVSRSQAGAEIRIRGARDNGSLRIEVLDQGPEFRLDAAPSGHGLDILRGRLNALFGDRAALALERRDSWNQMTLSVPQTGNGHARVSG